MRTIEVTAVGMNCPYCGNGQAHIIKEPGILPQVYICEPEEGGCNNYFVAELSLKIEARIRKIEEEG